MPIWSLFTFHCVLLTCFFFPACPISVLSSLSSPRMTAPPPVVNVQWLEEHRSQVKIVAVSGAMPPKPNYKEFREKHYGKFEELIKGDATKPSELIPGATYFSLAVAYYPGEFKRFELYPPELFQEYIRLLGIDAKDHVVVYSSGPSAGMLFAARAWWTFKVYGHENVSVLSGGLDAWKSAGLPVVSEIAHVKKGNWKAAGDFDYTRLITFEELEGNGGRGTNLFEHLDTINYLDARPKEQFTGEQPLGIPVSAAATGSHIKGSKSLPLTEVMTLNGLKSKEEIEAALQRVHFNNSKPIVTACLTGTQASLLALALESAGYKARVFTGSLMEVAAREPKYINEK